MNLRPSERRRKSELPSKANLLQHQYNIVTHAGRTLPVAVDADGREAGGKHHTLLREYTVTTAVTIAYGIGTDFVAPDFL